MLWRWQQTALNISAACHSRYWGDGRSEVAPRGSFPGPRSQASSPLGRARKNLCFLLRLPPRTDPFSFAHLSIRARLMAKPEVNGEEMHVPWKARLSPETVSGAALPCRSTDGAEGDSSNPQEPAVLHASQKWVRGHIWSLGLQHHPVPTTPGRGHS